MSVKTTGLINLISKTWIRILIVLLISFVALISVSKFYSISKVKEYASLEEFITYMDERIPILMNDYDIPGVCIALIQKGQITWTKAYGYADIEKGRKMTTDTYCRVESISKSVTAWAVMQLVEQGKIGLDKPVKHYIKNWEFPESEFSEEKITVRQLLTNTAGMPLGDIFERYSPEDQIPSLKESLTKQAVLIQEPGVSFLYSNTGYNLLELLIEEVTGRNYAEYMEKEVLIPLGMYNSSFDWSKELKPAVPVGYDTKGNPISVYVYPEKASGGLFASVEDIAAFVAAGMPSYFYTDHRVLTSESINKLYTPMVEKPGIYDLVFDSYGLGYYIETLENGKQSVANGGQGGGVMTFFQAVPETGDGIVILTNSQRSWPFFGYILSDWARWSGFKTIGMGKIIWAQKALWTLIASFWIIMLWGVCRIAKGVISGKRRFSPLSKKSHRIHLAQSGLAIIILIGLLWCINQDYLFISSIFPIASGWLGFSFFIFAVILLLSALFPGIEDNKKTADDFI